MNHQKDLRSAAIATIRFGLGAKRGEIDLAGIHPKRYLLEQLEGNATPALYQRWPGQQELRERQIGFNRQMSQMKAEAKDKGPTGKESAQSKKKVFNGYVRSVLMAEAIAKVDIAVTTDRPFRERLVNFWYNHFMVPAAKLPLTLTVGAYQREAIRPHVTGKFEEMLMAVVKSPSMLFYLDNDKSIGPNSIIGKRRNKGLNENLGREILELHTLGVNGGYVQEDVVALSKGLTGWSIGLPQRKGTRAGGFQFYAMAHEPGVHQLLGKNYPQHGLSQGEAMLHDIAHHPATARFISAKLATHFVSDAPPIEVIDRLAGVFRSTGGDLGEVSRALVETEACWDGALNKLKQPIDYVHSVFRSLDIQFANGRLQFPEPQEKIEWKNKNARHVRTYFNLLKSMGQAPFDAPGPQGWYDRTADWAGPDSIAKRIEWAVAMASLVSDKAEALDLLNYSLGPLASDATKTAVKRAESNEQGIAIVLASPEMQRR